MSETVGESETTFGAAWKRLRQFGPAFVLAAVIIGPGSLTLSTIAGNQYGYQLLWVPIVATVFMLAFTWMSARIGLVTGGTVLQATRERYGSTVATVGGVFAFLSLLAFQAGNNAGIGSKIIVNDPSRNGAKPITLTVVGVLDPDARTCSRIRRERPWTWLTSALTSSTRSS